LALYTFMVSVVLMLLATGLLLGPGLLSNAVISIGWAVLPILVASGLYLAFTRCPECRNPFNRRGALFDLSVRRCINCGFRPSGSQGAAA
jgi:hypothetical protein